MARIGLVGPSYTSQSVNADCQLTMNWYPEVLESGNAKSALAMYPTPGLFIFSTIKSPVRGLFTWNTRMFAVGGDTLYEIDHAGAATTLGTVPNDGLPVSFAANNAQQLIVCSGGQLWAFALSGMPFYTLSLSTAITQIQEPSYALSQVFFQGANPFNVGDQIWLDGLTTLPLYNAPPAYSCIQVQNGPTYYFVLLTVPGPTDLTGIMPETGTAQKAVFTAGPIQVAVGQGPFSFVDYIDGYFIATVEASQQFQISGLEDAQSWDAADVAKVSEFPDNVLSMIVNQEIVWFFGTKKTIPYYDSGDPLFPIVPVQNVLIEQGIAAPYSRVKLDNSIFWIGADERGQGIAWRANGYTPVRVSTHAIEYAWSQYGTYANAVGYAYQDQGHAFWVLYFPTADATWVYDVATNSWHQRDNYVNGLSHAHPSWNHVFQFGLHLVGDPTSGNINIMSVNLLSNNGTAIRRVRRALHISREQEWTRHNELQIYLESGLGTFAGVAKGLVQLVVPDAGGVLWRMIVQDGGGVAFFPFPTELPISPLLTFKDVTTGSFYQLTTDSILPILTQIPATAKFYDTLQFITFPGSLQSGLLVSNGMLVTTMAQNPLRGSILMLRWSDDGGHTWSNYYNLDCGMIGQFKARALKRRLGRARDRVYEISCTDAVPWRIVDAYLKASPGFQPVERVSDQLRKAG